MQSWISRRVLAAVGLGAVLATGGSALAVGGGPAKAKIVVKGGESFKPNAYIKSTLHFGTGTVTVRSGGTITLTNTTGDPHTLSIVNRSQLPRTIGQVENCGVCKSIAKAHGVSEQSSGPPSHPLVDVGSPGFNQPGDSVIIGPKGPHGHVTFRVTAKPGTTLSFMCAIHPWMQGRILVK